jgi:hypothetical protein
MTTNRERVMRRTLLLLTSPFLLAVCGGDPDFTTDRTPSEGGVSVLPPNSPDAEGNLNEAGGEPCPDNEPKLGDRCPPGFSEGNSCTYEVDKCTAPNGTVYADYLNYCCQGTLWVSCGGQSACDAFDAAVPDGPGADAGPPFDAASDAPDGGQSDADPDAGATD